MKISRINQFRNHIITWRKRLGLNDWRCYCDLKTLHGQCAWIDIDREAKQAEIFLNRKPEPEEYLEELALHEVLHIVFSDLLHGVDKFMSETLMEEREHAAINRLIRAFIDKR